MANIISHGKNKEITVGIFAGDFCGNRGIAIVNKELLKRLLEDDDLKFYVFGYLKELAEFYTFFPKDPSKFQSGPFNKKIPQFIYKRFICYHLYQKKVDLFWYAKNYATFRLVKNTPIVLTVHDILGIANPKLQSGNTSVFRSLRRRVNGATIQHADKIVAVSEFTKTELNKHIKVTKEKIQVIPHGVDHRSFFPILNRKELNLNKPEKVFNGKFILYAGAFNEYKNIALLIESFINSQLYKKNYKFYLIGPDSKVKGNNKKQLQSWVESKGLQSSIIFINGVSHYTELAKYYQRTDVLLNASLYEGFGLTVLEAMACGAVVIVSNIPPHREIVGDSSPWLVDPYNLNDWVNRLNYWEKLSDKEKDKVKGKNIEIAKSYLWEDRAHEYSKLFKKLLMRSND